jgi:NAD(P)-dependent dehydrogenase (short-subunit alcohol dehydrogenase family)
MSKFFLALAFVVVAAVSYVYQAIVLIPVKYQPVDMTGKVCVVTGGSSGIGFESVRKLTEWNATVIMPVRSMSKGESVRSKIMKSLPAGSIGNIEVTKLDLTSFKSVRAFASEMLSRNIHIDILMLNAGMQNGDSLLLSDDGVEMVYQVNHLSHFLLTRLLLPLLGSNDQAIGGRIVHVASSMHYGGSLNHDAYSSDALNSRNETMRLGMMSYCDTKLMNVVFSNTLDRYLRQTPDNYYKQVSSVSIHPGFVVSELDRGLPEMLQFIIKNIRALIARPTIDGAVTQVAAATKDSIIARGGGLYYEDQCIMSDCTACGFCEVNVKGGVVPHASALDEAEQDWLWKTSSEIVGLPVAM